MYVEKIGWRLFFARLAGALFLLAGVALWSAGHFDWIALRSHPFQRIGALVLVMALCGLTYFGSLLAMGFRFADFKRQSA